MWKGAITVFLSGLSVMMFELVAGRLVAPYFGQSTRTWAALTAVTLAGVTLGNSLGGWWAGRSHRPARVAGVGLLAGGVYAAVLPLLLPFVAGAVRTLGGIDLQTALFTTVAWLPLMGVLGLVTPSIAAACVQAESNGRDLGHLYLASMIGSALGSGVGGLYLPFVLPADVIHGIFGALLVAVAVPCFVSFAGTASGRAAASASSVSQTASGGGRVGYLFLLVFALGWIGMGVELACVRLVAPVLGGNHVVWALVFVTFIGAMGVGGGVGGRLADRFPTVVTVVVSFVLLAVVLLGTVSIETRVLPDLVAEWPALGRILALTVCAFAPLALALGVASTVLLKFATGPMLAQGRKSVVGFMYALSSAGCVCGTFVTGYWCIGRLPSTDICLVCAFALVVLALGLTRQEGASAGLCRLRAPLMGAALVFGVLVFARMTGNGGWTNGFISRPLPSEMHLAEQHVLLHTEESPYNVVSVTAKSGKPHTRTIWLDRVAHTDVDLLSPKTLCSTYTRMIDIAAEAVLPKTQAALFMIGGGGYALPRKWTQTEGRWRRLVVAEIDAAVRKAALECLDAAPAHTNGVEYVVDDGRRIMERLLVDEGAEGTFDVVVGDTISDTAIPYHLVTKEFDARVKRLLKPDGVYVLHVLDRLDDARLLGSLMKTLSVVFRHVSAFSYQGEKDLRQSFIVVASDAAEKTRTGEFARTLEARHRDAFPIVLDERECAKLADRAEALELTDRFSPVERFVWQVISRDTDRVPFRMGEEAKRLMAEDREEEALALALATLKRRPLEHGAMRVLVDYACLHPENREVLAELRRQAARREIDFIAKSAVAYVLGERGEYRESEKTWRELRDRDPENIGFARSWVESARKAGLGKEADAWLREHPQVRQGITP